MNEIFLLLLLGLITVSGFGAVQDQRCDDCVTVMEGLLQASMSNESLTMQKGMILQNICPDAGLGAPEDHPNCEKFTEHHFDDLAASLFQYLLSYEMCSSDLGFCPNNFKGYKEVDCDTCSSVIRLVAGILSQEDKIVSLVEYMIGNFCQNGVPEQDAQFCQDYVSVVLPLELPWLATSVDHMALPICDYFFGLPCM